MTTPLRRKAESQPERPLTLRAEDAEDLMVFSSLLQDAVVRVGDMAYLPSTNRFAMVLNRFVWEHTVDGDRRRAERVRTGLHFEHVISARARDIPLLERDHVLELLAVVPNEGEDEAPDTIDLVFAGGGQIRLTVGATEAHLKDMTEPWPARTLPTHD